MPLVKTWLGTLAPARATDADPWVLLRIREAASPVGPWATIENAIVWSDATPSSPTPTDIETQNAQYEGGWYSFQWQDASGEKSPWTVPVYWTLSGGVVEVVSALVRARTRDDFGNELGIFTDKTRPTAQEVEVLYDSEAAMVSLTTGSLTDLACPSADRIRQGAMQVIAKRVAAIIEASYRPDEVAQGRTVADFYQGDRDADLDALTAAAGQCRIYEPGDPEGGGSALDPIGYFPPPCRVVI